MNRYENVIIADADYIDKVAFDLIVNFERMIMRRIPPADIARWMVCIALDGGLRETSTTHVVLVHDKEKEVLDNFTPANYAEELNGKAFKDKLGEFVISALPVESNTNKVDFMLEIVQTICADKAAKRVMIIPNAEDEALWQALQVILRHVDDEEKRITVFAMQPMPGGNFRQEILGYSLMNALGINAEEVPTS